MTHRAQLAILALLAILLLVFALFPRQAASDAPVVATAVPAGEFIDVTPGATEGIGVQAGRDRKPSQPARLSQTLPVVGSPPILEKPAPSPSAPRPVSVAPVSRHPVGRQSASSGATPAAGPTAPSVTGHSVPAATSTPLRGKFGVVVGTASWYRYVVGGAAAGPRLRAALGPGWRGSVVTVCAAVCVRVRLSDFMRADRLVDLDSRTFSRLAPLSRGVVEVSVRW